MNSKTGLIGGLVAMLCVQALNVSADEAESSTCLNETRAALSEAKASGSGLVLARENFVQCAKQARIDLLATLSAASVENAAAPDPEQVFPQGGDILPPAGDQAGTKNLTRTLVAQNLQTQAVASAVKTALDVAKAEDEADDINKEQEDEEKFLGFNWGLGVGASFGLGADRVESAELVNGLVRVSEEVTNTPRIVLEVHNFLNLEESDDRSFGHGPFAAINFGASDADTLTSFGAGYMWGVKRKDSSSSFNVGIGLMLDRGIQQLGDGIEEGKALPEGETEIRFKKESELAALLFISSTF